LVLRHIGWGHEYAQQQPEGVYENVSLDSFGFLGRIVAAFAGLIVPERTVWLSRMAAIGSRQLSTSNSHLCADMVNFLPVAPSLPQSQ
jgi:hypothetical protein